MSDVATQIKETVESNDVVLYMKGTKTMPQCGQVTSPPSSFSTWNGFPQTQGMENCPISLV